MEEKDNPQKSQQNKPNDTFTYTWTSDGKKSSGNKSDFDFGGFSTPFDFFEQFFGKDKKELSISSKIIHLKQKLLIMFDIKNKHLGYPLLILFLVGGWFYWFQIRPSHIKKECYTSSVENARKNDNLGNDKFYVTTYDAYYKRCLEKNGL